MNRRNFVTAIPVFAAGIAGATPLVAMSQPTESQAVAAQTLLAEMRQHFAAHLTTGDAQQRALLQRLSTPASRPRFDNDQLSFRAISGEKVVLYRRNKQFRVHIGA